MNNDNWSTIFAWVLFITGISMFGVFVATSWHDKCKNVEQELSYYKVAIKTVLTEEQQAQVQNQVKLMQQQFENKKE